MLAAILISHQTSLMRKILFLAAIIIVSSISLNAQTANCSLTRISDSLFAGICQISDSTLFSLQLKPASPKHPSILYGRGTMKGRPENMPLFLEIKNDTGILGTSFFVNSWYKVQNVKLGEKKIEFTYNPNSISPASDINLVILRQVKKYFTDSSNWNRDDRRARGISNCQPKTKQVTLYCALYYASEDIMGEFYAGPSFKAILDAVTRVRTYTGHTLQSFNNDPKTTFAELHEVLNDAINRMEKELQTK